MRITIKLTWMLLIMLGFGACDIEDDSTYDDTYYSAYNYTYYKIDENLYPLLFDTGSYWIYENINNLLIDSIIIVGFEIDTFYIGPGGSGQGPIGEEQYFNLTYKSDVSGIYEEQLIAYFISRGLVYGGCVYISSQSIGDTWSNAQISAIFDSLIINNRTYRNVVKMKLVQDKYLDTDMNLYYSDSIGIVKKEIIEDSMIVGTWNLLRYNTQLYKIE
jgi:hypothetical protein